MDNDRAGKGGPGRPKTARAFRRLSAPVRRLPDFVVIGGIRCGTSSIFNYLAAHQEVAVSTRKELHYFDRHYDRGSSWYRSWFPARWEGARLTGEATPSYLMNLDAPERAYETIPDAKFVVMLRDPVDRAISHFNLRMQKGHEECATLAEALEDESNRVGIVSNSHRLGHNLDCYFLQGEYVRGLEWWFRYFDPEQFCILTSEALFENPATTYTKILDFLDIGKTQFPDFVVHNAAPEHESDNQTAELLRQRYMPANQKLYDLIGTDLGW